MVTCPAAISSLVSTERVQQRGPTPVKTARRSMTGSPTPRGSDQAVRQVGHGFAALLALGVEIQVVEKFAESDVSLQGCRGGKEVAGVEESVLGRELFGEQGQRRGQCLAVGGGDVIG